MSEEKGIVSVAPKDVFIELDRRDQQQIVMAALGDVVDELFYKVHGRNSLSWEGINTAAYLMGDIEIDPWTEWERVEMFEGRVYWSATVRARNTKYNLASLGTAESPELMDVYDRDEQGNKIPDTYGPGEFKEHLEPDEFCRRKALSKAQRNAKRAVMPTAVLSKYLQYFIELKLFKKGTRLEKPEMPFKPKTVDAEYKVLGDVKPEKASKSEKKEKPKKTPPKEEPKPEEEVEAPPQGRPRTVEEVAKIISDKIIGSDELVVVSDRGEYWRIGKRTKLDEEIEYKIDSIVELAGGSWDQEKNAWVIPKEAS